MPLNGAGTAAKPAGSTAVSNTTIESSKMNSVIDDIYSIFNTARPLAYGGTGGTSQITGWDGLSAKGTDIASAGTINLTTATGPRVDITGTATITAVTLAAGSIRIARATGIFQITASASLVVNKSTSVNYTTAVGDLLIFTADGSVVSVTAIGSGGTAATTSAAGIVELATTTEAFQASSSTLAVTPAGLANLYSTALGLAIEVADLKGSRLNMAGGIADAYDSETDVDTATSTNESYDSALDLYSPTSPASTEQSATVDNQTNTLGFTYIEMGWAINNSVTLTQFRIYSLTAFSGTARVLERTSASNFTSRANSAFSHTGSGWEEFAVSYAVPGSGDFYVGLYSAGTPSGQRSAAENRAFVSGDISTSTSGATEAGSGLRPTVGVRWSVTPDNMTLVSNAFTATAVPTVARVACFIDPQVTITINTDFTAEASRDGGTTWTAATLALVSNPVGTVEQYEGTVSISSQPSGTSMKYRLKTLNNKDIDVTGVVFQWS
jgi:hypothetical protein